MSFRVKVITKNTYMSAVFCLNMLFRHVTICEDVNESSNINTGSGEIYTDKMLSLFLRYLDTITISQDSLCCALITLLNIIKYEILVPDTVYIFGFLNM